MSTAAALAGTRVAITRPAGTGAAFARRVRALGGTPLLLPGSSLRAAADATLVRAALRDALAGDLVIFTSPAAVRFARRLLPLAGRARALAPGRGTRAALLRAGQQRVSAPACENSEGILALPELQAVRGAHIAIIGAPGGRGVLTRDLSTRGAVVTQVHVYRRLPARLDQRHARALLDAADAPLYVLVTSGEALTNIVACLPLAARCALLTATAVVSSARLAATAAQSGFARTLEARSPHADELLAQVVADRAGKPVPASMRR